MQKTILVRHKHFKVDDTIIYFDGKRSYPVKIIADRGLYYIGRHHGDQYVQIDRTNEGFFFDNAMQVPNKLWRQYYN